MVHKLPQDMGAEHGWEFEASIGYIAKSCLKKIKKNEHKLEHKGSPHGMFVCFKDQKMYDL